MANKLIDHTGTRHGMLTVLHRAPARPGIGHAYWLCRCKCGTLVEVRSNELVRATSCGCLRADPETRRQARLKTSPRKRKQIARKGARARWGANT